ncbi:hypothetical protein H4Q26_001226 [Puccinia striiformis f. sp. tritici PST-130]|nr:hypothetical protein H4Q26_001226 [Puccinia striiformis f. sp. tritici PST-130]
MTHRLAHHFKMSQMLQRSTVFSMVNLYNSAFMGDHTPPLYTPQQSFLPQMSVEVCKDGMDINTLVFDYASRGKVLMVPSSGLDCVGYNETKKQCSSWIAAEGTAHKNHSCGLCTVGRQGKLACLVRAVVTDDAAKIFDARVNSNFQLHSMLKRLGSKLNLDPTVHLEEEAGKIVDLDAL